MPQSRRKKPSMKNCVRAVCALTLLTATALTPPAWAMDEEPPVHDLQVSKLGDVNMTCGELSEESALMRDIIETTQDIRDESKMKENGIGVAGAAASFLVGTLTGGLGIAAAGYLANEAVEDKSDGAESVQDIAEQRRSFITGIYNSKGCLGPIDHVAQNAKVIEADAKATADREKSLDTIDPAAGEPKSAIIKASYNE